MKRYIYILGFILLIFAGIVKGQQYPLFSQWDNNINFINPAATGESEYITGTMLYRNQWVGFKHSPKTLGINLTGRFMDNTGLGLTYINDKVGIFNQSNLSGNYAYHLQLNEDSLNLSLGLSGSLLINRIDYSLIDMYYDQANYLIYYMHYSNEKQNDYTGTASIGAYLYKNNRYFAGLSIQNLVHSQIDFNSGIKGYYVPHYFAIGGYTIKADEQFDMTGTGMLKYTRKSDIQGELGLKGIYLKKYSLGVSYRTGESIGFSLSMLFKKNFCFFYSYDLGINSLKNYHSNSHEISLRYVIK
ncbi:MAG: PorP/SprF family type IX secretion system membrane protein [Bacteroidales bacterium]|nr:PorP/SprF family type IX secretion system membrane protein [Bacteroidales bacterium]